MLKDHKRSSVGADRLFFDLTGELEVDDNNQVTGASIGLADAGSDLPPMPCLRRNAGNEKCGR